MRNKESGVAYNVSIQFDPENSNHLVWLSPPNGPVQKLTNQQLRIIGSLVADELTARASARKIKEPSMRSLKKLLP